MNIDFLNSQCNEPARTDELFGLIDDQDNSPAYSDIENPGLWIATVLNPDRVDAVFTPLDHCIEAKQEGTSDDESLCDGMLTTRQCLYLVELKDRMHGGWATRSEEQLTNTIELLKANHNLTPYRFKKAYQCNRRFPSFKATDNEENLRFYRTHGFRLDRNSTIKIT